MTFIDDTKVRALADKLVVAAYLDGRQELDVVSDETLSARSALEQVLLQQTEARPVLSEPNRIGLYQGPDDCPQLMINDRPVAIFPAGSWAEVCDALDSITGSAQKQGQAVAWVSRHDAMFSDAGNWRYTNPVLCSSQESPDLIPLYTAPPSAPVGVEGVEAALQKWLDWCNENNEEPEAKSGARIAIEALAQQPAAIDMNKITATFRCESNGIVGMTNAPVYDVRPQDDGYIEVVIDHWPGRPPAVVDEKYAELVYAVSRKYPGESRHETALRYIRQAESADHGPAQTDTQHKEPKS